MKKALILISILLIFTIHYACKNKTVSPDSPIINFNKMEVGQYSRYAGSISKNWTLDSDTTFKPKFDTIQLKILLKDSLLGYFIEELHLNEKNRSSAYYYFNIKNDTLFVKANPNVNYYNSSFFNITSSVFPLKTNSINNWTINKWLIPVVYKQGIFDGISNDFTMNGINYGTALFFFDSSANAFDGPTVIRFYNKDRGFLSFQDLNPRMTSGNIYNLVE